MSLIVEQGAKLMCSFGTTPSTLICTNSPTVQCPMGAIATISDAAPMVNIPPFGMCTSMANPQVASATAAAMGVLTPQPCIPQTQSWIPGNALTVLATNKPVLTQECTCMCAYAGMIKIIEPGQAIVLN